jgi:uncharacterized coiled-coil protein SlyX
MKDDNKRISKKEMFEMGASIVLLKLDKRVETLESRINVASQIFELLQKSLKNSGEIYENLDERLRKLEGAKDGYNDEKTRKLIRERRKSDYDGNEN